MAPDARPDATYTAEQFAPLFAAEDRHFWFRTRNRCIVAALRSLPDFAGIHRVLEVGCGTGVVLAALQKALPGGEVVGMDLFEEGLAFARQRFNGPLICGDVATHRFPEPFDVIGAFDVIEHLDDDVEILRRLRAQLRPGGHVLVTVPAHPALWSYFDEVAHHRRRYVPAELRAKLTRVGFEVAHVTQFMSALFLPLWMKRHVGGRMSGLATASATDRQGAVESDLRIHPFVNVAIETLLRPEAWFVAHRIRLPLGTSLLAVARRPISPDS